MPSKTPAQKRLMDAVAHNPEFARKVGIPQKIGREFERADKRKRTKSSIHQIMDLTTGDTVVDEIFRI